MTVEQTVLYDVTDSVACLRLNRPERLNAWTPEMGARCEELLARAADDPGVRAIVITGSGRAFCAGADLKLLDDNRAAAGVGDAVRKASPWLVRDIPKPVIAAVNGPCVGLGLVIALMCDLRFAAAGSKLALPFARLGLVAEDGTAWVLPRLVGPAHAFDLLVSGRTLLAEEALSMGLVNRVVPGEELVSSTVGYARELSTNCSPAAMAVIKHQLTAQAPTLTEAVVEADRLTTAALASTDFAESMSSRAERRKPAYPPLSSGRAQQSD